MVGNSKFNFAHCGAGAEAIIQAIQLHDIPVISRPQVLPSQYPLNSNLTMRPARGMLSRRTLLPLSRHLASERKSRAMKRRRYQYGCLTRKRHTVSEEVKIYGNFGFMKPFPMDAVHAERKS
jgi:hypothetical protein